MNSDINAINRRTLIEQCARNIAIQRRNAPETEAAQKAAEHNLQLFPQLDAYGVTPKEVLDEADKRSYSV